MAHVPREARASLDPPLLQNPELRDRVLVPKRHDRD